MDDSTSENLVCGIEDLTNTTDKIVKELSEIKLILRELNSSIKLLRVFK